MNEDAIRTELAGLRDTMHAGFARVDHYFELLQGQYVQLRADVRELRDLLIALTARVDRLEQRISALEEKVGGLENEVRALRDWVTRELADVRGELRLLRTAAENDADLRRDVAELGARVTQLEERLEDRRA
jgi:chromosome segregation ATPase